MVERAQPGKVLSGAAQFHSLPHQVYDVNAAFYLIYLGHAYKDYRRAWEAAQGTRSLLRQPGI